MTRFCIKNIHLVTRNTIQPNCGILLHGNTIERVFPMSQKPSLAGIPSLDGNGAWALPGLIDLHIHGFGGYGPELGTPEALWAMSKQLALHGVSAFCPTLYCATPSKMKQLLTRLTPAVGQEKGAKILGFHLEGPFISPAKPGVMKPKDISPANVRILEELYQAAQGKIAIVTLAPELKNINPVIKFCLKHHIVPQAGHTNATYEEFLHAMQLGVTHVTHAFNAMSPFTQRAPGVAGAVLMNRHVSCEMIADGVHVHPHIISFLRTVKPANKLILVTDALLPTAQKKGPFIANGESVVFEGGVWRRKADKVIAGSALTLTKGIQNLVDFGYSLPQAVGCASYNPARLLHLRKCGRIVPGFQANITLINKQFVPQAVFIQGKRIL